MKKWMEGTLLVAMSTIAGCNNLGPGSNPAAILEGTWTAVFAVPGDLALADVQFIFDANGALTQITATPPAGATVTFNVTDATTTQVDGDQVTVTIPTAAGARIFTGTLSSDQNTITGSLSLSVDFPGGSNITLPSGDLTLTRQ